MNESELALFEKLKALRTRTDLKLKPNKHLRTSIKMLDGTEKPLCLRSYQVQMVLHLMAMPKFVVGDDCGLGKTIELITALSLMFDRNPNLRVLVLTKKSAVSQWAGEIGRFTEGITPICIKGDKKNRHKIYDQFQQSHPIQPTVLVAGYRSLVQDFTTVQGWEWDIIVFDECSAFKNPSAQVHQICRHLGRQSERVYGLTATLIKNNLVEGYGIYKVIMPELFTHTPAAFIQDYCMIQMQNIGRGRKVPVIVGYRNSDIERFKFKIEPYYLGRPKHEVAAELPPLTTKICYVGMTPFQHNRYNEALAGLLTVGQASINGMEEKEVTKLTAVTYCQEITNHPSLIGYPDEESEKLNELVEMLSEGGELHGKKVIVFTRFEKMVTLGVAALEKANVKSVRITGAEQDTKRLGDQRKINQDIFQDMKSGVQVVWITMAGSDAINLQAAECIIFYDTPFSAGDYLQCLGRLIRIGSIHQAVLAIHLVVEKTIDERVVEIVEKKMRLIEAVIGKRLKGDSDALDTSDIEAGKGDVVELFDALRRDALSGRDTGILHV